MDQLYSGEYIWHYQTVPIDRRDGRLVSAEPFADVKWTTHVDLATGRPIERSGARYEDGFENIYPSPFGAHSSGAAP